MYTHKFTLGVNTTSESTFHWTENSGSK